MQLLFFIEVQQSICLGESTSNHARVITAAAKVQPIEFQNQQAVPIRSLAFLQVDGRPHPVSGSMLLTKSQDKQWVLNAVQRDF